MKYLFLILLTSCGFSGNQKLTLQGEAIQYVQVNLGFISEIRQLCETLHTDSQEIAQCTLDNIKVFNLDLSGAIDLTCGTQTELPPELEGICGVSNIDIGEDPNLTRIGL
jgi:hypothetical protein